LKEDDSQIMTKPFEIDKHLIVAAWKSVRENAGSHGVDKLTIEEIGRDLKTHLYKLWNRMSSGSYMASPVRKVEIPKADGKTRTLGIPTVLDRVAQMAAVLLIEKKLDAEFHESSYGYRRNRSALQGIEKARQECFQKAYVVDLDIKGFFDNIPHDKMMEMVERYIDNPWVKLYISRWLKAEMQDQKGVKTAREKGTPQGGVISPLLANLYLHVAFDSWMAEQFNGITFERYADDVIIHCISLKQAQYVLSQVWKRMEAFGLELHPDKTKVVYCWQDGRERRNDPGVEKKFDFLGYTFQTRDYKNRATGKIRNVFTPAVSDKAKKRIKSAIKDLKISKLTGRELKDIAGILNPKLQGWNTYYSKFRRWNLYELFRDLDGKIVKWYQKKYKGQNVRAAWKWLNDLKSREPRMFAHWVFMKGRPACVKGRAV
jgi:RNA-directed DNA polymerase